MTSFDDSLGGMRAIPQFFVWKLVWDGASGKYQKSPGVEYCLDASLQANWSTYEDAVATVAALPQVPELRYALGFWLTAGCGYWFLDLDKAMGVPFAEQLVGALSGAMVEWSSSGKGLHVIGRGVVPKHRSKPARDVAQRLLPLELELYTSGRGIAFGLSGEATGSADVVLDMTQVVEAYFPPRAVVDGGARGEWRGPADDDVLIERMLGARLSAEAAFGGKASLPQLWRGECEHESGNDMALASHLAFWTGCDEERMLRLMWRSGMVRDKWHAHHTYLQLTIGNAIDNCANVYQEPQRNLAIQTEMYGSESVVTHVAGGGLGDALYERQSKLLDMVSACGTEREMIDVVIPKIYGSEIPGVLQERIVSEVKNRLKLWGNSMSVAKLRATLFPPAKRSEGDSELPDWALPFAFCSNGDKFFNTDNGQSMTMVGFQAVFGRNMAIGDTGRRDSAPERCLHFWGMPIVEQIGYRPDCGPLFEWDGVKYANLYSPSSVPGVADVWSAEGVAGIEAFQAMLFDMCGRRRDVFNTLLYWYAHNVQKPGVKIRWAPIIKGVHGDGKTLAVSVLRAAMGHRNVKTTSNSNINNSGGFTDWAVRGAVNVIEEIMLTGLARHSLYNAMKEFISNDIVDINTKGAKPYQSFNVTNHYANTNHNDGVPMERTDRRWFVIFTPWSSLSDMQKYCGMSAAGWKGRTDAIDLAMRHCAGEVRKWFLSVDIPSTFDINGSAMMTPEKMRMMASSNDEAETVAADIVGDSKVISSSMLTNRLAYRATQDGFELPRTTALNHVISRLGYSKIGKQIKFSGQMHTIWLKNGVELSNDEIRIELEASSLLTANLQPR
ncbi:MAG: DUF5906 domain-containing protein [Luteimonas sp.]